jgi:imidazolonepropionase-like amidohydrolase
VADTPEDTLALTGATVFTAVGPPIRDATIIVENGKFTAVGHNVPIPSGIEVLDLSGRVIIPGLIDQHSHLGMLNDNNEGPMPFGPENRAIDGMHMDIADWDHAVTGGVTTVITGPGSGERMGGQSITIKTFGSDLQKRILKEAGELKMAVNANNLTYIPLIRSHFLRAREYLDARERYESGGGGGVPPERDLRLEALSKALTGEEMVRVHIGYANDILSLLRLKDEFGFDLVFIHSNEAYKVADEIARRNVGCITMPLAFAYGVSDDQMRGNVVLHDAGVKVSLHTDYRVTQQKWLLLSAALSIRYGLPEDVALKAITIHPAELSRIDNRVGSIEPGKDADFVVLDGTWYELVTNVDMVFVDGVLAYDRARDEMPPEEIR